MATNITIQVDDSQVDLAIARLNEALAKTEQSFAVAGQVVVPELTSGEVVGEGQSVGFSFEDALGLGKEAGSGFADFWTNQENTLRKFENKTLNAKTNAQDVIVEEGSKIQGLNYSVRRIVSQMPILREAYSYAEQLKRIDKFGINSLGGAVSILFLALNIYNLVTRMIEEQKQQKEQYEEAIMELRGFTTKTQFNYWQDSQQKILNKYRSGIIP